MASPHAILPDGGSDDGTGAAPFSVPVYSALTGNHLARVVARAADTALAVGNAAAQAAGLRVSLRLLHNGKALSDSVTVEEAGIQAGEPLLAVAEKRQRRIERVIEVYEQAEKLNACFMVDCTGSMGPHINAVRSQVLEIVREMHARLPAMQLRLAFVGYRDHCDWARFELLPFTASIQEFQSFLAQVRATGGGGDGPEDVHGAVDQACGLDWAAGGAATRVLIHIADHPAHGRQWNNSPRDSYPDGDPCGLDLVGLMEKLRSMDVQYIFGHITDHTLKMVQVLNEELGGYVDTKDMGEVAQVAGAVTSSLHASVATTVSTLSRGARDKPAPVELCSDLPDWSRVPEALVRISRCLLVTDARHLQAEADPSSTRRFAESSARVRLAPLPFSQGESRVAKHAMCDGTPMVSKHFKVAAGGSGADGASCASDSEDGDEEEHLALSEASTVASFLAGMFSETRAAGEKVAFLLSDAAEGDGAPPFNIEAELPVGEFQRFSNNIGWWEPDAPRTLMEFTRWTHEVTKGHMMVVDLQGVKTADGWLLTDPCVLCEDVQRFGRGNLGPHAISRCLKTLGQHLDAPPASLADLAPAAVRAPPNAWKPSGHASDTVLDVDGLIGMLLGARGKRGKGVQVPEQQVRALVSCARDVFLRQPTLLEVDAPLNIMGDTHGHFHDMLDLFELGGPPPRANYLLLGDYVDRGKYSTETLCLLLAYKVKYPENFFMLRGNHECSSITRIYGFYDECKRRYNIKLWKYCCDAFNCMPPAALVGDRVLCMHGGISPELRSLDQIRDIARPAAVPDSGLLCDLLWADPDADLSGWCENDRGVSYSFGRDALVALQDKLGLDLVVRAHQVVEDGYEFFADRRLVTVFSAPRYCGEFDNAAAVMTIDDDLRCSFRVLPDRGAGGSSRPGAPPDEAARQKRWRYPGAGWVR